MSDYGGDEFYDDFGDSEWLYVEDYYDEADQLAEYTCPSPPALDLDGVPADQDVDMYEYWADIEFMDDDGFFDRRQLGSQTGRKRKAPGWAQSPKKRRTATAPAPRPATREPTVIWISQKDQNFLFSPTDPPSSNASTKTFALLKDWRNLTHGESVVAFANDDAQPDKDDEPASEGSESAEGEVDAFDFGDLKQVAGMLTNDQITALRDMLAAKGMDPEALDEVLQDMIEGKEPELDNMDDEEENEESEASTPKDVSATKSLPQLDDLLDAGPQYDNPIPKANLVDGPRGGAKRKAGEFDDDMSSDERPQTRKRRAQGGDSTSHPLTPPPSVAEQEDPSQRRPLRRARRLANRADHF